MGHGPSGMPTELAQAARKFKVLLARLTPNKTAEAEIMGVRQSTIDRWCNPTQYKPQMPAWAIPYHSEAETLLSVLASQVRCRLVPMTRKERLNGDIDDEVWGALEDLGQLAEQCREAHEDLTSPGKIDADEAKLLAVKADELARVAGRMVAELNEIIMGAASAQVDAEE